MAGTDRLSTEKRCKQQSIQEWTLTDGDRQAKNVPEGRKIESKPIAFTKRRMKGKLTKKEQSAMRKKHKDIGLMLAPNQHLSGSQSTMRRLWKML